MRIGLNLLHILPEITGGWNYLRSLLEALAEHGQGARFVAFVTPASQALVPRSERFEMVRLRLPASVRPLRVLFENLAIGAIAARHRVDTLHHFGGTLPLLGSVPGVVTIYDLLVFARQVRGRPLNRHYLRRVVPRTARRAAMLTPISRTTARELAERMGVPPERMRVVPPVIAPRFEPRAAGEVEAFRSRHGLPPRFWLCVARPYPHKDYAGLVAAYARLCAGGRGDWPLVVRAAQSPALERLLARDGVADRVLRLPPLPDGEMPLLYSAASALVFPSLYEGAGLPLLEAMACGCPAAASDIATTREFAGGAAVRFAPGDAGAMEAAMATLYDSDEARARCRAAGFERAAALGGADAAAAFLDAHALAASRAQDRRRAADAPLAQPGAA